LEELRAGISKLAQEELIRANSLHMMFPSPQHGHGVLKEEIEECGEAYTHLKAYLDRIWFDIRRDRETPVALLNNMGDQAINLACEVVQVVAMVRKYIDSMEDKVYE